MKSRAIRTCLLLLVLTAILLPRVGIAAPAVTPEQVETSLKKAREYIYAQQKGDSWELVERAIGPENPKWIYGSNGAQYGGRTALAVYALLSSGSSAQEPKINAAIEWLKKIKMPGTYALGVRCQVWLMLPKTAEVKKLIEQDFKQLMENMHKKGPWRAKFYYIKTSQADAGDHSVSQYGVLGLWACERAGLEVPTDIWKNIESSWVAEQKDGGWCYGEEPASNRPVNHAMTAAGVATLFITQDYVHSMAGLRCTGNIKNAPLDKGMKWLADNFKKLPSEPYTLYGIERIGVASGYKYFDTHDWFQAGAQKLLTTQNKENGSWHASEGEELVGSCFGVIFLSRGRAPVVMNKLEYDTGEKDKRIEAHWNQRPRDVANLTKYIGKQIERDLNWQIVNLKVSVDDLHDAPILYMSGNQNISLLPEEEAKLKQFIDQGGIILGHADCASENFAKSFRQLGTRLAPSYEFRELPNDHPIYTNQQFSRAKWKTKPSLLGLSNGVRELMLLLPTNDPAKSWQLQDDRVKEEHFQVVANIFLYAVDKQNLRYKGETYIVSSDPKAKGDRTIKVARLQHDANWNPEPGGWLRLANVMKNQNKVDLHTTPVKLDIGALKDFKIAHLTGTARLSLNSSARDELKKFIEAGGTLIVDSAGGSSEFSEAVERELGEIFTAQSGELKDPLPAEHAIYSNLKMDDINYRAYARRSVGAIRRAQIRGMKINDRAAVLYSREDISGGLVGQPVDGVIGYDPNSATMIMSSLLLHAAGGAK